MSMSFTQLEHGVNDAVDKIAAARGHLDQLHAAAQGIVSTMSRIVTESGAIATELDARTDPATGDQAGNAAWTALKARKDEVVADLVSVRARANAILAAIDAVGS